MSIIDIPARIRSIDKNFYAVLFRSMLDVKYWFRRKYIKSLHWEYWPMWMVYFPVSFYYLWLCMKIRSLFFFSAANPTIETGGMFFESKWDIFKLIPQQYYPVTAIIHAGTTIESTLSKMQENGLTFPVIAKPDRGERGWCVEIVENTEALKNYVARHPIDFLLQQYINFPVEMSIFYYRHPSDEHGRITSVTQKEYLNVTGDGHSTLLELIIKNDRAFLQLEHLKKNAAIHLNKIIPQGMNEVLVPFGNHVRGAMFLDKANIIDKELTDLFDLISKQIPGFYYGRFDFKCNSLEELKKGKLSILELNGSGAEPAHIYQPGYSFFKAQRVLARHYKMMYAAAKANHQTGTPYMDLRSYKEIKAAEKLYKQRVLTS